MLVKLSLAIGACCVVVGGGILAPVWKFTTGCLVYMLSVFYYQVILSSVHFFPLGLEHLIHTKINLDIFFHPHAVVAAAGVRYER